jgi:hypothetical protein
MDYSDSATFVVKIPEDFPNLVFLQGNIAALTFRLGNIDYVSCDQVIVHTQQPEQTSVQLASLMHPRRGQFACCFYVKKALPRELLDDYFRIKRDHMSSDELWIISEKLAKLGRILTDLNIMFELPVITGPGFVAGKYDVQRFIYWNFLKCFWNADLGLENSIACNFDWYSPSNVRRLDEAEVKKKAGDNCLHEIFFHREEVCFSGQGAPNP